MLERIEHGGIHYADVIRAGARVENTTFFSPPESSFQFGLLAHRAGYKESPHYHRPFSRTIDDIQQMFVVQKGLIVIALYADDGALVKELTLGPGDAIVLIHGVHRLRVVEDMQCISVKQGPFLGAGFDKVDVQVNE